MKKIVMIITLINASIFAEENSKHQQAKQKALGIIASLTDTIATLIINQHCIKDPLVTKACCVDLVNHLADALATAIICKIEENKDKDQESQVRSIALHDIESEIDFLADQLTEKIKN